MLDCEQDRPEPGREVVRQDGPRLDGELLERALDGQTPFVDSGDMLGVHVAEEHRVAVPGETRPDRAPDRAGTNDCVVDRRHGGIVAATRRAWIDGRRGAVP